MCRSGYYGATVSITLCYHKAFHAKMGTIKDRKGKDPTEAEDMKKRWQEHKEKLYKKIPCCPR